MAEELVEDLVEEYTGNRIPEEWDVKGLETAFLRQFGFRLPLPEELDGDLQDYLTEQVQERFQAKSEEIGPELFAQLQQMVMLQIVDNHWKEHLLSMDHLRDGIGLRGYAQVDPLREYQREGYDAFMDLIHRIKADSVGALFHLQVRPNQEPTVEEERRRAQRLSFSHGDGSAAQPQERQQKKVGRTTPAPAAAAKI
jgi:preprotein translocase subunit SecA